MNETEKTTSTGNTPAREMHGGSDSRIHQEEGHPPWSASQYLGLILGGVSLLFALFLFLINNTSLMRGTTLVPSDSSFINLFVLLVQGIPFPMVSGYMSGKVKTTANRVGLILCIVGLAASCIAVAIPQF